MDRCIIAKFLQIALDYNADIRGENLNISKLPQKSFKSLTFASRLAEIGKSVRSNKRAVQYACARRKRALGKTCSI